jgi:two-component system response regulator LytT
MILKCIAVDDEPLALKLVENFIQQTPFLQLVKSCLSAIEAMKILSENAVDLIFLDINMPNLTGMELARVLAQSASPQTKVIFTTAYNHFAIEGYKVNAIDYLLKPFNYEEFLRATNKALTLAQQSVNGDINKEEDSLFLKVEYQWVKIEYKDILYIEGLKDYIKIHAEKPATSILSLTSLKALEERLPSARFMRVHRSYIVALEKIHSINKTSVRIGNIEIPVGENYKESFKAIVDKWIL